MALVKTDFPLDGGVGVDLFQGKLLEGGDMVGGEVVGKAEMKPTFQAESVLAGGGVGILGKLGCELLKPR